MKRQNSVVLNAVVLLAMAAGLVFSGVSIRNAKAAFSSQLSLLGLSSALESTELGVIEVEGVIDSIEADSYVVGGFAFRFDSLTSITGDLAVGDSVHIRALLLPDATSYALSIEELTTAVTTPGFDYFGLVDSIDTDVWVISSGIVSITGSTVIDAGIEVGDLVQVHGTVSGGLLVAGTISLVDGDPVGSGSEVEFFGTIESITGSEYVIGGKTVNTDAMSVIDAGLVVGDLVKVTATLNADSTYLASTITLAVTPAQEELTFTGAVESISDTEWMVGGMTFLVDAATVITGDPLVGDTVLVTYVEQDDGSFRALSIELAPEGLTFTGTVESISDTEWMVGGMTFLVDAETIITGDPLVGDTVLVTYVEQEDGSFLALSIVKADDNQDDDDENGSRVFDFIGALESISDTEWVVGGVSFGITSDTQLVGEMVVGDIVKVHAKRFSDGSLEAMKIHLARENAVEFTFVGEVESMSDSAWVIDGLTLAVDSSTKINGHISVGDLVKVHAILNEDGTYTAVKIHPNGPKDDNGDENEDDLEVIEFNGTVESVSDDQWVVGGMTFLVNSSTEFEGDPQLGDFVEVEYTQESDGSLLAHKIDAQNDDGPTGDEEMIKFTGTVESISDELWVVGGMSFVVAPFTDIEDNPQLGDMVEVKYFVRSDGSLQVVKIDAEHDSSSERNRSGGDRRDSSDDDQQRWTKDGGSRKDDGSYRNGGGSHDDDHEDDRDEGDD